MKTIYQSNPMLRFPVLLIMFALALLLPFKPSFAQRKVALRRVESKPSQPTGDKHASGPEETAQAAKPNAVSPTKVQLPASAHPGTLVLASAGIELVWIPPGEYVIGSSEDDLARVIRLVPSRPACRQTSSRSMGIR